MRLNPADRENGLALLGTQNGRERARRKPNASAQWVGVRADAGVGNGGRWAFCVWNETGGNLRVGWSCAEASLKLGCDQWSFGYGGTATKSHANNFTKFGQTYGQGDAVTCCIDLDRRAILYMKNGREIPGDAFNLGKEMAGWPMFPHVYTKEATFAVSFDGKGGAPPLTGGFQWMASAGRNLVPSPLQAPADAGLEDIEEDGANKGAGFVLTSYGWRTAEEAGVPQESQEWRGALDAYVKHFTSLLELEYEAEREAVVERVHKQTPARIQSDGVGVVGLSAEFDHEAGRVTLWMDVGRLPYLAEISRGRTVLLSTVDGGVNVDDASKTISGEVESIQNNTLVVSTQYERLPVSNAGTRQQSNAKYRVDLGPNIVAYKRIDRMLDELQRCLGTAQAKAARNQIEKLNANQNLTGLLLPGTPLAIALYADISESSAAASKWDPLSRPASVPDADISRASRERDVGAPPYRPKGPPPSLAAAPSLNASQQEAVRLVLLRRRRFNLIQGPPGTGKTTTAIAIICGWLLSRRAPILATAFSNRGTDNLAEGLHRLGVRVLRMGLCEREKPYSLEARLTECGARWGDKGIQAVMRTVDVVAATCIGSGMGPLDRLTFPFVVVDEAAQVIEPAVLLPLGKGAVQAVMVGDQCQLPATVLSQEAQRRGLDISMFDRLLSMGMEVQMLKEQYRMHTQIAAFASWRFYRRELRTGVPYSARQRPPGLPFRAPVAFLHVEALEQSRGPSKANPAEAACLGWLVGRILQGLSSRPSEGQVGIITPYAAQVSEIRSSLPHSAKHWVQISSVDAFQGCEKDIVLVSLVRANQWGEVGFVADWRRLNVALTRAKCLCVLVGHLPTWLSTESSLIRDWLGFHGSGTADVLSFSGGAVQGLAGDLARQVRALQAEFARERPEAGALPRVSQTAKDGTSSGKRRLQMLEAARALADAIGGEEEAALETALSGARLAAVQTSTIEEGEDALRRLVATRELALAVAAGDEELLQKALVQAKEASVKAVKVKEGEIALRQLVAERELGESRSSRDEALVRKAIAEAKAAGVNTSAGELVLRGLVATRELIEAVGVEEERPLMMAIARAKQAGVQSRCIEEAESLLARVVALKDLKSAACGADEAELQEALDKAEEAGVKRSELASGSAALKRLRAARDLAEIVEHDGTEYGYEEMLRVALEAAQQAGVTGASVEAAEARLNVMRTLAELAAALEADDEQELGQAVDAAENVGLSGDASLAAESRLHELRSFYEDCAPAAEAPLTGLIAASGAGWEAVLGGDNAAKRRKVEVGMEYDHEVATGMFAGDDATPAAIPAISGIAQAVDEAALCSAVDAAVNAAAFNATATHEEASPEWSLCRLEMAMLRCCKRKAVEAEDFDLAHEVKMREADVSARLEAARQRFLSSHSDGHGPSAHLAELGCRKRQAAAEEDFELCAELQKQQQELEQRHREVQPAQELERVRARKREAVEQENFELADDLKRQESELERHLSRQQGFQVEEAALALLAEAGPEALLLCCDPGVAGFAVGAGPDFWQGVAADLQRAA